jgi:hypothetical protein
MRLKVVRPLPRDRGSRNGREDKCSQQEQDQHADSPAAAAPTSSVRVAWVSISTRLAVNTFQ